MKSIFSGFFRGSGYTLGRIFIYLVLAYFIFSYLGRCDNETIKSMFPFILS